MHGRLLSQSYRVFSFPNKIMYGRWRFIIKFLASDKGFAMQPKSEWHEKAIRWFIKEMYK